MKRRWTGVLLCMMAVLLCCCRKDTTDDVSGSPGETLAADSEGGGQSGDGSGFRMAVKSEVMNCPYAVNDKGAYEIYTHEDGTANILYTDFESAQRIYLSANLSGAHDTEDDTSFIKDMSGGIVPFAAGGYVYLLHAGVEAYGSNEAVPGHLYRIDKDGQNRKELVVFDENYTVPSSAVVYDGKKLYMLSEDKSNGQKKCLISIGCGDGKIEKIRDLDWGNWFIAGAYENEIILKEIKMPELTEGMTAEELYLAQTHTLTAYDPADGSERQLAQWSQDKMTALVAEGKLFMLDNEAEVLQVMAIQSGETKTVLDGGALDFVPWDHTEGIDLADAGDGYIEMAVTYRDSENSKNSESGEKSQNSDGGENSGYSGNSKKSVYMISVADGKVTPLGEWKGEGDGRSLNMIGMWKDKYLVSTGYLEVPVAFTAPDGSRQEGIQVFDDLALIGREDYRNGNFENLQKIENTFLRR